MADIDVVKKSSHLWLWILIVLVVVVALFFLFGRGAETRNGFLDRNGGQPLAAASPPGHVHVSMCA